MNKFLSLFTLSAQCRNYATKLTADGKVIPKKKFFESRITLIGSDNAITITDLKHAQSFSARRELKLVKIQDEDSKTKRPVYKLMTSAEYHQEELQKRKGKQAARMNSFLKGEKLLNLSSRIGDHDLMTNVKKMLKLLEKQYEVRVVIASEGEDGVQSSERIYSVIENNVKTVGKVVQKRNKGNHLKFQVLPSKDATKNRSGNEENSDQSEDNQENRHQNEDNKGPI